MKTQKKRRGSAARGTRWHEVWVQDVRYGLRALSRSPGFALVAVLTLGLGIGATTAVFSVIDGVLLRPLAYPDAERLHVLWEATPQGGLRPASYPTFEDVKRETRAFSGLTYIRGEDLVIRGAEGPQRLVGAFVSGDFFRTLGTPPLLGRGFGEASPGEDRVAVLSYRIWRQLFGGDPSVIGRQITTTGEGQFTVVGVMPPGFQAPLWADVWVPLSALPAGGAYALRDRALHVDAQILGRLAPGVESRRAEAELTALAARFAQAYPEDYKDWTRVSLVPAREDVLGDVAPRLLLLGAAVGLVLLVACVNVANLMLARASTRAREIAIRVALGAGRVRVVLQLLTEGLVLALLGGMLGVLLSIGGVHLLRRSAPDALPRMAEIAVDGRVLVFALGLSVLSALFFGLLPALRAASPELVESLKGGTAGAGVSRGAVRLRASLVVAEVALALMLVVGAGLLIKSLWQLQRVDLGFQPERVAVVRIFPPPGRYDDPAEAEQLYRRLREAAAAVPGVEAAALVNHVPLAGGAMPTRVVTGRPPPAEGEFALYRTASPEYFRTMGIPVLRGRPLGEADMASEGGGVVVNRTLAREFFPDEDPIGKSITVFRSAQGRPGFGEPLSAEIVGLVEDERFFGLDQDPPPAVFLPYTWTVWPNIFLVVKTASEPARLIPALRRAVLAVDPDLPVAGPGIQSDFRTLSEYTAGRLAVQRLNTVLLGAFAGSAFLLSVIGIFGIMAYVVVQRTREIGVRLALGAQPRDVVLMMTRDALALAAAGIALGLAGALAATRLLRSLLYGVSVTDPAIFAAVAIAFAGAALLAGSVPAFRAARVDPMVAFRTE